MGEKLEHSSKASSPKYERTQGRILLSPGEEIVHGFTLEETIDTSTFDQGAKYLVDEVDIRDLSEFPFSVRKMMGDPRTISKHLNSIHDPAIRAELREIGRTSQMLPCTAEALPTIAFHAGCTVFVNKEGSVIDKITMMRMKGVYGATGRVSYFGISEYDALFHGLGNYNDVTKKGTRLPEARIIMLTIGMSQLAEKRNIFRDPESLLGFEHEYGKNFVVHHGIPVSAIRKMEVLRYEGMV